MDKYLINRQNMDKFKNSAKYTKTEKERIVEEILRKQGLKYTFKKGFLRAAKDFCIVDFFISKPYRAGIQILEDKANQLDTEVFRERKFHLLTLNEEDFKTKTILESKIRTFFVNAYNRNQAPKKMRQVIVR